MEEGLALLYNSANPLPLQKLLATDKEENEEAPRVDLGNDISRDSQQFHSTNSTSQFEVSAKFSLFDLIQNIKVLFRTGLVGVTRLFQPPQTRILANSLRELQHVTQVLSSSTCAGSPPPSPPCTLTSLQVCSWSQVSETIEGVGRL